MAKNENRLFFFGYMKNLGTNDEVTKMYGTGTNVDQLISASAELTYNVPHWKIGVEYNFSLHGDGFTT